MALRFFADHCISNLVIETLRAASYEVVRLKDLIPAESPDSIAIAKAQEVGAILLSLDGDFADIVTYPPRKYRGIIALQAHNHPEIFPALLARLVGYLKLNPAMEHDRGKLMVVGVDRIRIRQ